jgi:iron-sulfur cluster repair protein YtfE (RIC family)
LRRVALRIYFDTLIKAGAHLLGHKPAGGAVHTIRHLSKEYAIPGDACNTFMVTYQKLKEFEDDLHKHVHLEQRKK